MVKEKKLRYKKLKELKRLGELISNTISESPSEELRKAAYKILEGDDLVEIQKKIETYILELKETYKLGLTETGVIYYLKKVDMAIFEYLYEGGEEKWKINS